MYCLYLQYKQYHNNTRYYNFRLQNVLTILKMAFLINSNVVSEVIGLLIAAIETI